MPCSCKDWEENFPVITDLCLFYDLHGGGGYNGKKFVHCPWCGERLDETTIQESDIQEAQS